MHLFWKLCIVVGLSYTIVGIVVFVLKGFAWVHDNLPLEPAMIMIFGSLLAAAAVVGVVCEDLTKKNETETEEL